MKGCDKMFKYDKSIDMDEWIAKEYYHKESSKWKIYSDLSLGV